MIVVKLGDTKLETLFDEARKISFAGFQNCTNLLSKCADISRGFTPKTIQIHFGTLQGAKHQRSRLNFPTKKARLKTATNAQLSRNKPLQWK